MVGFVCWILKVLRIFFYDHRFWCATRIAMRLVSVIIVVSDFAIQYRVAGRPSSAWAGRDGLVYFFRKFHRHYAIDLARGGIRSLFSLCSLSAWHIWPSEASLVKSVRDAFDLFSGLLISDQVSSTYNFQWVRARVSFQHICFSNVKQLRREALS